MRVAAFVVLALAACGPAGPRVELPQAPARSLADTEPQLVAGERTSWTVFWKAVQIGEADLVVDAHGAHTSFHTNAVASTLANVRYSLTTRLEHGAVVGLDETSTIDGNAQDISVDVDGAAFTHRDGAVEQVPGGTRLHTLQSALGVVRAWSRTKARTGYLWLLHGGKLYRLDVYEPTRDDVLSVRALRVDGIVRALDGTPPVEIQLWLSANRDRTPLRFALGDVIAEVNESTGSFD